jgi:thioredoxin 1
MTCQSLEDNEMHTLQKLCLALVMIAPSAFALTIEPFSQQRFEHLQQQHQPIVIDVHADWCPTCQKQQFVFQQYQAQHPNSGITVLKIDFDQQKSWVKYFRAPRQSTLIMFEGKQKKWVSVGETGQEIIFKQLDQIKTTAVQP